MSTKNSVLAVFLIAILFIACSKNDNEQVYAGFDVSSGPYIAPCEILFFNQSVNADSYLWDFGDGISSTEINPVHIYESAGTYEIVLNASNDSGSKSYSKSLTVVNEMAVVGTPPDSLGLDPYYKKYLNADGLPVISSENVPDDALFQAMEIVKEMLKNMPEVREKIISYDGRLGIMGVDEVTTDIPEHAFLANDTTINWDERARGLGGTVEVPITTCAEENLLCYSADPYYNEDILIHEFAHAIHLMGLQFVYPDFNDELNEAYASALNEGKWNNTYAATNMQEYWAEGVQSWFNCNAESDPPNGIHNHVNTRAELQQYDAGLYQLLLNYFGDATIDISCHNY